MGTRSHHFQVARIWPMKWLGWLKSRGVRSPCKGPSQVSWWWIQVWGLSCASNPQKSYWPHKRGRLWRVQWGQWRGRAIQLRSNPVDPKGNFHPKIKGRLMMNKLKSDWWKKMFTLVVRGRPQINPMMHRPPTMNVFLDLCWGAKSRTPVKIVSTIANWESRPENGCKNLLIWNHHLTVGCQSNNLTKGEEHCKEKYCPQRSNW